MLRGWRISFEEDSRDSSSPDRPGEGPVDRPDCAFVRPRFAFGRIKAENIGNVKEAELDPPGRPASRLKSFSDLPVENGDRDGQQSE